MSEEEYLESQEFDPKEYTVIEWPHSQDVIHYDEEKFDVHLINDEVGLDLYGSSAYIVPKDLNNILV